MAEAQDRAPAVTRAFSVLDVLLQNGPLQLADIVEKSGLNKSTVFYILKTLASLDVVDHDAVTRRYRLGPALVQLGAAAAAHFSELGLARRELENVAGRINATLVIYRRLDQETITILDKIEFPDRVRITLPSGEHIPIQGGSFGRAFLAYDPPATVEKVLRNGLQSFTPKSVTDVELFKAELEQVRVRGWALDHEGYALGISTVAAPVFAPNGAVTLVIAAVGFTNLIDETIAAEYGAELRRAADAIGRAISQSQEVFDQPSR